MINLTVHADFREHSQTALGAPANCVQKGQRFGHLVTMGQLIMYLFDLKFTRL